MAGKTIGVPVKLLHEAEGHVVTAELKNGEIYRGMLDEAEDTMNCAMSNVTFTARNGKVSKLESVYIRGSHVKLLILPDMLRNAPVFKKVQGLRGKNQTPAAGRGRGSFKRKK
ncbi:unnamed protein product [Heterosigma akashiwo]|uniref:Small nuclear ribonucleoprotein Sm D3 n=1 Tax=Heterosigma akashiwo TaxID=2829 RepID=A0A6S9H3G1_HETAK|mmetsp:Transcript_19051/g.26176  ORF Transcript_19051/g.26176 Transcript_19051/m.26176 type:complete len:113 (+) Transcript_19051:107-445(+)|eukprot:CAMPEP_0206396476 /NCGR_PEP_ID=MMETSP0294-20121207/22810_1 /ASSEMBLY_ACC=CAM_ASM_000327 /TAXON_ID=39354 /ORGANISM="Heterosigma akashiwo, Strain CCMP2393" /LENGTH=112 /DNA_ID=CAMNT_0053851219 /DNA_START=100 /DNA_END=441 /DNA_ORIENTATION=+